MIQEIAREIQRKLTTSVGKRASAKAVRAERESDLLPDRDRGQWGALTRLKATADRLRLSEEAVHPGRSDHREHNARDRPRSTRTCPGPMDVRGTIINNMNVLLRNLTLINVVFLPPNVLASVGGMSEFTMMTGSARAMHGPPWWVTYPLFLVGLTLVGLVVWQVLRRWMERTMSS